jgi:hypothetical protein
MKKLIIGLVLSSTLMSVPAVSFADTEEAHNLKAITDAALKVCGEIKQSGDYSSTNFKAGLNLGLAKLFKIFSFDASGDLSLETASKTYTNVAQEDLPKLLNDSMHCKLTAIQIFAEVLNYAKQTSVTQTNSASEQGTAIQGSENTTVTNGSANSVGAGAAVTTGGGTASVTNNYPRQPSNRPDSLNVGPTGSVEIGKLKQNGCMNGPNVDGRMKLNEGEQNINCDNPAPSVPTPISSEEYPTLVQMLKDGATMFYNSMMPIDIICYPSAGKSCNNLQDTLVKAFQEAGWKAHKNKSVKSNRHTDYKALKPGVHIFADGQEPGRYLSGHIGAAANVSVEQHQAAQGDTVIKIVIVESP